MTIIIIYIIKVGNDQEMAQSERNSHSTNLWVGKTILSSDFRPANILRISVQERLTMLMLLSIHNEKMFGLKNSRKNDKLITLK